MASPSPSTQKRFGQLPDTIINRAADYMLRRYGAHASLRANARCRRLIKEGRQDLAEEWSRVAKTIDASKSRNDHGELLVHASSRKVRGREKALS